MKIAVLSGKGGTGKTFVSVNLSVCGNCSTYIDCDVEEPNGHLFLKPDNLSEREVYKLLPTFDKEKCCGCRKCVDFCKFNALAFIKGRPILFSEVCHSCGGCLLACEYNAVTEVKHCIGKIQEGRHNKTSVITGIMNIGEVSGISIIDSMLNKNYDNDTIIDCPPGSACSVMESVKTSDYCVLVAEPTTFGLHNFKMVLELVTLLNKPFGIVINKVYDENNPLYDYCIKNILPILCSIKYTDNLAKLISDGKIASEEDTEVRDIFTNILSQIKRQVAK